MFVAAICFSQLDAVWSLLHAAVCCCCMLLLLLLLLNWLSCCERANERRTGNPLCVVFVVQNCQVPCCLFFQRIVILFGHVT